MDEKEIERMARALGTRRVQDFDVDTSAIRVLERLKAERRRRVWWKSPVLARAAAVALVVGAAGWIATKEGVFSGKEAGFAVPYELSGLSTAQLHEVLDSLTFDAPAFEQVSVGLDDLDADQLTQLLNAMEG